MKQVGHLRVIDPDGEIHEDCPSCVQYEKQIRILNTRLTKLQNDSEAKAREHKLWTEAETVHDWWRIACDHPGTRFAAEDFYQALPRLNEVGPVGILKAVAGAAYDPGEKRMKNGRTTKYDSFELINRSKTKLESFAERAPGKVDGQEWKVWLVNRIESRLS